jgi:putative SOS response-associated peptidase YedK
MRWRLTPSWAKDSSAAGSMIDARAETAATKLAFHDALKSRRCLIRQRILRVDANGKI